MDTQLNKRLLLVRNNLKLKQGDFATQLGVKQGTISDVERERIGVSNKLAEKLANTFGVSKAWFYTGEGEEFIANNLNLSNKTFKNFPEISPSFTEEQQMAARMSLAYQSQNFDNQTLIDKLNESLNGIEKDSVYNLNIYFFEILKHLKCYKQNADGKNFDIAEFEKKKDSIVKSVIDFDKYFNNEDIMKSNASMFFKIKHIEATNKVSTVVLDEILKITKEMYLKSLDKNEN